MNMTPAKFLKISVCSIFSVIQSTRRRGRNVITKKRKKIPQKRNTQQSQHVVLENFESIKKVKIRKTIGTKLKNSKLQTFAI